MPSHDGAVSKNGPPDGDDASLELFIRENGAELLNYIRNNFPLMLRQRYDPLDLYQTTVFEAFRRMGSFRHVDEAATRAWLQVLARRQIGMALRNERREKRGGGVTPLALEDEDATRLLRAYGQSQRTPSQSAVRHESLLLVERALGELPAHLREALTLRYLAGHSPAEVAQAMGRTERAAATLCFRGLRLLRRKLRALSPSV